MQIFTYLNLFYMLSFRSFCLQMVDLGKFWPSIIIRVWTPIHPTLISWSLEYAAASNFAEERRALESAVQRVNSMANEDAIKSHHTLLQFTFTTFTRKSPFRWHQIASLSIRVLLVCNSWKLILIYLSLQR